LVENLISFPCSLIFDGTGTRCPVKYILRKKINLTGKPCKVNEIECEQKDLCLHIIKHMQAIENSPEKFSSNELIVSIWGAAIDAVVTDLPGLCINDARGNIVSKLVQQKVSKKDCYIAIVINSVENYNTHQAIQTLSSWLDVDVQDWKKEQS